MSEMVFIIHKTGFINYKLYLTHLERFKWTYSTVQSFRLLLKDSYFLQCIANEEIFTMTYKSLLDFIGYTTLYQHSTTTKKLYIQFTYIYQAW